MQTTKDRYAKIKQALNNGMSQLSATKKFNASMSTISRIRSSKNYEDFISTSSIASKQRRLKIKPVDNRREKVPTVDEARKQIKAYNKNHKKSPWGKLKSFFGI